ncbi:hypothetical protein M9Y10_012976 [Tritrichomonas musculus]|uniref:Raptor N-terminal CASPase-like domain-containing protein n=1 Tax=Tritrichomonas musculus TaxID=1915356 RepID=A0ABR2I641_9EUKA
MLPRTELINFADLADEDEYSFIDEEKSDNFGISGKNANDGIFVSPKNLYHCSIEQQLPLIDTTVSSRSTSSTALSLDENDYKIDQIIKSLQLRQNIQIDGTRCAIIDIAHPAQYQLNSSDYLNSSPYFLTWTPINSASATEFPSIVQNNIKIDYQSINKELKFVHFVAPAAERMKNLSQIRKEIPIGRVIFHYIGFGLPTHTEGRISVCEGRSLKPYSVGRIFEDIRTPSWFIFDCDNAGSFIQTIMQRCQKLQSRTDKNSLINWCDWYCLCATSENEFLPKDPKLPRDFLTSCLLTPVKLSILCHILKYFRLSLDNPFQYLSQLEQSPDLHEMLTVITDAIASDYVKPKFFFQMFRNDHVVGTIFRRFILAQYLLKEYEVHPISNPSLPDMTKHQMWQEWEASLDIWISSNLTIPPSFCSSYFQRVSNFFTSAVQNGRPINQSILVTMCHIVLFQPELFAPIAIFASKSGENRSQLSTTILFKKFFQIFIENNVSPVAYESLSYIIIAMLQYDHNFFHEIKRDLNFLPLVHFIFDQSVSQSTRTFVTAILSFIVPHMKTIQDACLTKSFMVQLKTEISRANPIFLQWLLIFLKRVLNFSSADLSTFYNDSVHIQISSCIFHKSFECRASTVTALSCFMQSDENSVLNYILLMMTFPALFDMSYLVRYQFLLFVIRFLTTNQKELSNIMKDCTTDASFNSFNSIFERWIGGDSLYKVYNDFVLFAKAIDSASKKENLIREACSFCLFVIKYFCHDPHPSIKNISSLAKESFDNLLNNNNNEKAQKCHSISPPFGWHSANPIKEAMKRQVQVPLTPQRSANAMQQNASNLQKSSQIAQQLSTNSISRFFSQQNKKQENYKYLFESDSDVLFYSSLHQLVESGKDILGEKKQQPLEKQSSSTNSFVGGGGINIPTAHLHLRQQTHSQIKNPVRMAFERDTTRIVVAAKCKWMYHVDQQLNVSSKVKASEFPISDMKMTDDSKTAIAACCDGTIKMWHCGCNECYSCFRADVCFDDDQNPLLFDITTFSKKILTGRNGIQYYDMSTQRLISDWSTPYRVTAMTVHPGNENIAVVGLVNGNINAFDLRMKEKKSINFGKIISVGITEPIIKMASNTNGAGFLYGATASGKIIEWNATTNAVKIIKAQISSQLASFEMHKNLPLVAMAAVDDSPMICSPSGKILYKAKNIPPGSIFTFHPILPIISFGTPNSDLLSYDVLLAGDQKQ